MLGLRYLILILFTSFLITAGCSGQQEIEKRERKVESAVQSLTQKEISNWSGRENEVIALGKKFQLINPMELPESLDNIEYMSKPKTLEEHFHRNPFFAVKFVGAYVNEIYRQAGRYESITETAQSLANDIKSRGGIGKLYSVRWSAKNIGGASYKLTITAKNYMIPGSESFELYSQGIDFKNSKHTLANYKFRIDLDKKTLRPLTWKSWWVIDHDSANEHLKLPKEKGGDADVTNIAPDYHLTH